MTLFASLVSPDRDLRLDSEVRFLKFQRQILAQICAALGTAPAAPSATEHIAETKELAKDVAEILEYSRIKPCTLARGSPQSCVTVAVVHRALVGIGQHCVCLADLFELLFRVRIVRIA